MTVELNYDPSEVRTAEAQVISATVSGVVFGFLKGRTGIDAAQGVAFSPSLARNNNLRIGEMVEVSYVSNFPEHIHRVPWRAVAVYREAQREAAKPATSTPGPQKTLEQPVREIVLGGEVWNRGEVYFEMTNERFESMTATEVQRTRYDAIGAALHNLHDSAIIACAKVYAPGKKHASFTYYAKSTHALGRALMGLDMVDQEGEVL